MILENSKEFCKWLVDELGNKSVAVVGSSPNMIGKNHGALIDEHDVVIRFNNSSVVGYESSVGGKTSIRFIGFRVGPSHHDFFNSLDKENEKIVTISKNQDFFSDFNDTLVLNYLFHKASFKLVRSLLDDSLLEGIEFDRPPRTGFALMVHIFTVISSLNKLSVFGMERNFRSEGPEHFYNDGIQISRVLEIRKTKHCDIESELLMFNELLNKFEVDFYE